MDFKNLTKKHKILSLAIIGIFALIIISAIITTISHIGKIPTTVQFAPYAAKVSVNGKRIKNNGTVYLEEGNYELLVEMEHFSSYTATITIDQENHYIVGELEASDEEGTLLAQRYNKQYLKVEALAGKIANEAGQRRNEKYPILKYLPLNNSFYSISYSYDENKEPIITVKSDYEYLDIAVAKIKNFEGVSAEDYKIIFTPKNPYLYPVENFSTDPAKFVLKSFEDKNKFYLSDVETIDDYAIMQVYRIDSQQGYAYGHYRIILRKKEQSWEFAAAPQPLFTKDNAPEVPLNIIQAANSQI